MRGFVLAAAGVLVAGCRFGVGGFDGFEAAPSDLASPAEDANPVVVADLGDDLSHPGGPPPMLSGSFMTPPGDTDLSATGTTDWVHWGLAQPNDYDHRAGGEVIGNFALVGGSALYHSAVYAVGFTWSDGTPHATASHTTTGVYITGANNAFTLTVPADTHARELRVFVGGYNDTNRFVAHLDDGSAPDYSDMLVDGGVGVDRLYVVRYRAAAPSHLVVTWQIVSGPGNTSLLAATLASAE